MNELSIIVKVTAIAACGLIAASLARRARAAIRHLILASTFMALLLLPLTTSLVPDISIQVPIGAVTTALTPAIEAPSALPGASTSTTTASIVATTSPSWMPAWPTVVRGVWAVGTIALLMSLGASLWQFRRLRRGGLPWTDAAQNLSTLTTAAGVRQVQLVLHEDLAAPATWGWRQATVLLPSDAPKWTDMEIRRALIHEIEHVRRGDWGIHLLARTICAAFWFHPLVWLAFNRLCLEAERACDDAVLQASESADYAAQLVQLARRMSSAPAQPLLAMARRSDLATRVSAILDLTQSRGRLGADQIGAIVAAAAVLMLAVAPLRAVGASPRPAPAATAQSGQLRPAARRSAALDRALLEAAQDGDLDAMSSLIASGADVNGAVPGDGSPLIAAARSGRTIAVTFLLDRGADPNLAVIGDGNALIMAAQAGRIDIVQLLLARGANIEQVVQGDENALITASAAGQLAMVQLLVTRGANVNARVWVDGVWRGPGQPVLAGEWRTALNMAQRSGHTAIVNYLKSAGASD